MSRGTEMALVPYCSLNDLNIGGNFKVEYLSKSCQNFVTHGKKTNGAIVEKVRWCNSQKMNGKNNKIEQKFVKIDLK
jgi:hypothetical protein